MKLIRRYQNLSEIEILIQSGLIVLFLFFAQGKVAAEIIKTDPHNQYVKREFDWAMYIDLQELPHYLDYQSSSLNPLTKAAINFKPFPRGHGIPAEDGNARVYEELWYQKTTPLGSSRHFVLNLPKHESGIVVLRKIGSGQYRPHVAANSALRLILDLHFKQLNANVLAVPLEAYDQVASSLEYYGFSRASKSIEAGMSGKQFSIRLQSYPDRKDESYYYQR